MANCDNGYRESNARPPTATYCARTFILVRNFPFLKMRFSEDQIYPVRIIVLVVNPLDVHMELVISSGVLVQPPSPSRNFLPAASYFWRWHRIPEVVWFQFSLRNMVHVYCCPYPSASM